MKRKKRIWGVLMIAAALIIMQLPVSEADAATSASDFKIEGSTLVKYRGKDKNVSIPDTVEVIGRGAFEDDVNVELVVLPNSVKRIEPYAFWGCDNLDTVVLGMGMTEVEDYAFAGCRGLVQMSIPSQVKAIGIQAFAGCVNLKDVSIPPETASIHETAFDGCYRLIIHCDRGSAAEAYAEAFYERKKEMPEYEDVPDYDSPDSEQAGVTPPAEKAPAGQDTPPEQETSPEQDMGNVLGTTQVVGNRAFFIVSGKQLNARGKGQEADGLDSQDFPVIDVTEYDWDGAIPKYAITDDGVVADQAYYKSMALESVFLPVGIREIGQFSYARSSVEAIVMADGVERIGYGAFYHCDGLQSVTIPETVMCVEPKAFSHSLWVDEFLDGGGFGGFSGDFLIEGNVLVAYRGDAAVVTIPEGVRVIAGEAFLGHEEITGVSLPNSLLVIGEGAFEGCGGLERIIFGEKVREIKDRAFYGTDVKEISLPASVKALGLLAFGNAEIAYEGEEPERSYETSATRLSNVSYRVYENENNGDAQAPGVAVVGMEGAVAFLEGADRSYTLTVRQAEDVGSLKRACLRSAHVKLPDDVPVYDLTLTDDSGIPLSKLGQQALTVAFPVPESLSGQNLKLLTLDRNGQLEALAAERVLLDGVESFCFQTNHLSLFGLVGTGAAEDEEFLELHVDMDSFSAPPEVSVSPWQGVKLWAAGIMLTGGLYLVLPGGRKRRAVVHGYESGKS